MPAEATYEPIANTVTNTTTATVTFSSISGSYTDIILVGELATTSALSYVGARFNSDSGNNYFTQRLYSTEGNTTPDGSYYDSVSRAYIGTVDNTARSSFILNLQNYSSTSSDAFKSYFSLDSTPGYRNGLLTGTWASTSAITSIELSCPDASGFTSGSTFTLYGIKAA